MERRMGSEVCARYLPFLAIPTILFCIRPLLLYASFDPRAATALFSARFDRRNATARSAPARDVPCLDAPMTLAVGIGGKDCASRLQSVVRLRTLLHSFEETADEDSAHVLLWLDSGDDTTLPLVEGIVSDMEHVASIATVDVGNSTALTGEISPPVTTSFIYRRYDWVKFWGIHHPGNPRRYVLNVDVDVVFLRPLSEVWRDGCRGISEHGGAFYVAGEELLQTKSAHPGFTRYVNTGVTFLDLLRRDKAYNRTVLRDAIVPEAHSNKSLTTKGTWPPEQFLWNAVFHHHPAWLALFNISTQCNCATHGWFPGAEACKLAHYCNTFVPSLFNSTAKLAPFGSSLVKYIRQSLPGLYEREISAEQLECPS